jgi:hypothetical protein
MGEDAPEEILILLFGIRKVSASKEMTASLALPFSGFAVTRTFSESPSHPSTLVLEEPGTTLILSEDTLVSSSVGHQPKVSNVG